ncbi:MAG: HD domain-containing protein [Patescibacteria group bacterium]|nr:HD domain-containing protein [Patescibacteria group bacterium]
MKKLNYFTKKDSRIKRIYNYAKSKYNKANLPQHNWGHILRDLYRALIIAETEKGANYSILISAVLLHDIGVTENEYQKHEEVGPLIIKRDLPNFRYSKEEIGKIVHCVESHGGKIKPETIEAKILFDADRLEKSGISGIFSFYKAQQELKFPIDKWIERGIKRSQKFIKEGFYTKKAEKISKDGFRERLKHLNEVMKSLKERKDFLISEKDLW